MNKPIIAVDIDDVLAAQAEGFVRFSNERWGTNLTVEDFDEHWSDLWQVKHDVTERRALELHQSGVIGTYGHYDEATGVLRSLHEKYRLIIATSRRVSVKVETQEWLDRYFPNLFEAVYFAGIFDQPLMEGSFLKTKADLLKQYKADFLIDDQIKHCTAAAEAGVTALLYGDYPWNQTEKLPEGVTRCKDWEAVLEYFRGIA